jgi:hypothetical protein
MARDSVLFTSLHRRSYGRLHRVTPGERPSSFGATTFVRVFSFPFRLVAANGSCRAIRPLRYESMTRVGLVYCHIACSGLYVC